MRDKNKDLLLILLLMALLLLYLVVLFATTCRGATLTAEQTAMNAGEISPLLYGRIDFAKYNNGLKTLTNMLVTTQGPDIRRPGTRYIATVKDGNDVTRLIPFEYSKTDAYMLEFGDSYVRVFRNSTPIMDGNDPYEAVSPYCTSELDNIQYVQLADIMYMVDGNDQVQKLSRADHNDWTFAAVDFNDGPFQNENLTSVTLEITDVNIADADIPDWATGTGYTVDVNVVIEDYLLYICTTSHTSGASTKPNSGADWRQKWKNYLIPVDAEIQLTANSALWLEEDVNSLWQLSHKRAATVLSGSFTTDGTSDTIICEGDYTAVSHGTWTGTLRLESSYDDGSRWNLVEPRVVEGDDNLLRSDSEPEKDVLYRFVMVDHSTGTCKYSFTVHNTDHYGAVKITAFDSNTVVTGTVTSTLASMEPSKFWAEPYWSTVEGWPQTITFYEERLFFGGNTNYPQTIWATASSDYENMKTGVLDDDALIFMLPGQNPIQWMSPYRMLIIGTTAGVGRLSARSDDEAPITNSDINYKSQTSFGCSSIRAVSAGDAVLYVGRNGRKVRELVYDYGKDKYVAPDLTILSGHITNSSITEIALQTRPDTVLWCVKDNGDCAAMVYEADNEVVGWSRIVTDGDFESVAVIPGTDEEQVWFVVSRDVNSNPVRYIEQLQPRYWGDAQSDCFFVDSGLSYDGGDTVVISGITQADPGVVTVSTWPVDGDDVNLGDGHQIKIVGVVGMTEVNGSVYTISEPNTTDKTFELRNSADTADVNSVAYTTYVSGGTAQRFEKTFTDLDHLEGETVSVLSDGGVLTDVVVADGNAVVTQWSNKIHIGLPYTSVLETLPLPLKTEMGTLALNQKRLYELGIDFYETAGAEYGVASDDLQEISFYEVSDDTDLPPNLFSGMKHVNVHAGWNDQITVYIQQQYALPLTVRDIVFKVDVAR